MAVGAARLPPLTENCGAGAAALALLHVAVGGNGVPRLTRPFCADAMGAGGGAVLPTSPALVFGLVKPRLASLPKASLIVPPFKLIAGATAMPSASLSALTVV